MGSRCCSGGKSARGLQSSVDYLKVLAEENRLKIICILGKGETCVCDIWQELGLPQNLVSHHLKVLKDFGLISSKKEGLKVFYSLHRKNMGKYNDLLNNFLKL